jgi:hypothetical protein
MNLLPHNNLLGIIESQLLLPKERSNHLIFSLHTISSVGVCVIVSLLHQRMIVGGNQNPPFGLVPRGRVIFEQEFHRDDLWTLFYS